MINEDEDALICDLAETYHIYNMRELSPLKVAVFSCGLREDSRIKKKLAGLEFDINTLLLALCADALQFLAWCKTENAQKNINRPTSIMNILMHDDAGNDKPIGFRTAEQFEQSRMAIIERINNVNNSNSVCAGSSINEGNKKCINK